MKLAVIVDPNLLSTPGEGEKGENITLTQIRKALEAYEHNVNFLAADKTLLSALGAEKYEMIVNMAGKVEMGFKPAQFVGFFDLMDIPYTGSGVDAISLCKNRPLFKPIMQNNLIPIPNYQVLKIYSKKLPKISTDIHYPVVVKIYQVGIHRNQAEDAVAMDEKDLNNKLSNIVKSLKYSYCMIEEFIFGRKIYVFLLGNDLTNDLMTLPVMEAKIPTEDAQTILKSISLNPEMVELSAEDPIGKRAAKLAEQAFLYSNCRDMALATFLLDKSTGNLLLHEINPIPILLPGYVSARIAEAAGISYEEFLNRIMLTAMKRYDLKIPGKYSKLEKK
jgi:D-alanine-D-alanine ligase